MTFHTNTHIHDFAHTHDFSHTHTQARTYARAPTRYVLGQACASEWHILGRVQGDTS